MFKRKKKVTEPATSETAPLKPTTKYYVHIDGRNERYTKAMNQGQPHNRANLDLSSLRVTKTPSAPAVFIYSVNELGMKIPEHPFLPKGMVVPAKKKRAQYTLVLTFPKVLYSLKEDMCTGDLVPNPEKGIRVAVDIINPGCLGTDLDIADSTWGYGRDLSRQGLFYSLSNPPKIREVTAAKTRLRGYYTNLIDQVKATFWSGGKVWERHNAKEIAHASGVLGLVSPPWERRKKVRK